MTNRDAAFAGHWAYWCGEWVAFEGVRIAPDDLGFRQGVTAVERLRTYHRHPFEVAAHLDRWRRSVDAIGIAGLPDRDRLAALLSELLRRNEAVVKSEGDVGITLFATPGKAGGDSPTLGLHLNRLDFAKAERFRVRGQPLVVTDVVQPDPATWPRAIKVRSRLHYFLADREARRVDPDASGVLLDQDGTLTETGIASLAIIEGDAIVSPPVDRVLGGITQQVAERLADECSIAWSFRPITAGRASSASGIMLMGTDTGIWHASSLNGRPMAACEAYRRLRDRFERTVSGPTTSSEGA